MHIDASATTKIQTDTTLSLEKLTMLSLRRGTLVMSSKAGGALDVLTLLL